MTTSWRSCELAGNGGAGEWIRYDGDVTKSIERGHQQLQGEQQGEQQQQGEELTLQFDGFTIQLPQLLHVDSRDGSHRHIARFIGERLVLGNDEFLACDELECCEVSCFMDFGGGAAGAAADGEQVLCRAIDAATAAPLTRLPALRCFASNSECRDEAERQKLYALLKLDDPAQREHVVTKTTEHLSGLKARIAASFPCELLYAAAASDGDAAAAQKLVDGICALALYSSDFPAADPKLYNAVNTALRIMSCSGEPMFEFEDAAFLTYQLQPFVDAVGWMLRDVLPRCRRVVFRGVGFHLEQPRVGATYPQSCFNSTSPDHGAVQRFARRTLMVLITQSGASISFASFFGEEESEVLLPPNIELEVVARASQTLLSVLHLPVQLLTLREVGMELTPRELFDAARAVGPVYKGFLEIYQLPALLSQEAKEVMRLFDAGGDGAAGGGAAAGNSNGNANASGNPNAERLDAALDQNIINNTSNDNDMLIIAPGGTGKTAAAVFAQVHLSRQDAGRRLLPVFLPLSRLKQDDVTRQGGLDAALATALGCDVATLLQTVLEFNVVAILDSLDETTVKDEHWAGLLERNPAAQQCRVIMTSRPTPLATQQHQHIFGSARRVQVLDLLPLPQQDLNRIFAQLVEFPDAQLPAALLASDDATPLLAGFAATLVNKEAERLQRERGDEYKLDLRDITILDGIADPRELLELYLQRECNLPQQALSKLCVGLLARGFHCTLGEAKLFAEAADIASRVPCRVEDEFDDAADFSLLHRSLVEHVVARDVAARRLSFAWGASLQREVSPALITGITRMVLTDAQCPFDVQLDVAQHLIGVVADSSALELAQEMLADEERRAGGQPTNELARLLSMLGHGFQQRGDFQRAQEFGERAVSMEEAMYKPEQDASVKQLRGRNLANVCNNLANIYLRQQHYSAAQRHYERAIELGARHGEDEVGIAQTREGLAGVFSQQGDVTRALQEYERCLAIYERRLGHNHHHVASCLGNVGSAHNDLGQPQRALPLLQRALEIQSRELPPDHINIAYSHSNLGKAHRLLGNKPEARLRFQDAARIFRANGRHDRAQNLQQNLDALG